jgi:hypothetical protein
MVQLLVWNMMVDESFSPGRLPVSCYLLALQLRVQAQAGTPGNNVTESPLYALLPDIVEKRIIAVNSNRENTSKYSSLISPALPVDASALSEGLTVLCLPF